MKDRYLFRAKRTDNGEWVEGLLARYDERFEVANIVSNEILIPVIASTICQCTGLRDKHGKLIFENDIIKYNFGEEYAPIKYGVYQSCFDSTKTGHCGFYVDWPENANKRKDLGYWINMVDAEIAGNIFDNPELLE